MKNSNLPIVDPRALRRVSSLSTSTSTGLSNTNIFVASLSTSTSTGLSNVNSSVASISTGLSSIGSNVTSLSASTSTAVSTTNSAVASLSTSTSTSLSSSRSTIASLSTGLVTRFGTAYTKEWVGMQTTAAATVVFDISSASFASIVDIQPSAFLNNATVNNCPLTSIVARSLTSITVRLVESKNTGVLIGGNVEGLEDHAIAATDVYLSVKGT